MPIEEPHAMTREEIVALFARRQEAWQRHDAAALAADHAEDAVADSPMQGRLTGRARIEEVYASWFVAFPDLIRNCRELLIDDHRVVEIFTVSGTQSAPFGNVPATGRRLDIKGAWLSRLSPDGQIIADERLYDVTAVLVQLGVLRTKPIDKAG
jgi:steroid delta-isomerase-like uncharacterized protein